MEGIQAQGWEHSYAQGDQYSSRMPEAPRVIVPPPASDDSTLYNMQSLPPQFLPCPAKEKYLPAVTQLEMWEYANRHRAQQILPYLWLGPTTLTKRPEWFQEHKITMVLGVRSKPVKAMDTALQRVRDLGLEAQHVDVPQEPQLIRAFPIATSIIKEHVIRLNQNGQLAQVLVCCESGNDRSASVVAAFAMEVHPEVNHIKAIQLCQAQRFCAMFSDESKRMLQSYNDILHAQRAVANAQEHQGMTTRTVQLPTQKRQLDEDDEDMEVASFTTEHRRDYAPFVE